MIAPANQAPSQWTEPAGAAISAPKIAFLKDTVCRLDRNLMACQPAVPSAPVMEVVVQLIDIVMQLRSPMGGWPGNLEQTPENLTPYVGDEIWELLNALDQAPSEDTRDRQSETLALVSVSGLIPHLLWLLASSNYEVMRLLEGVRSRIYTTDTRFALGVVRLVPVLSLTLGNQTCSLDLVTQAEPDTSLFLEDSQLVKLVENDLDDQLMTVVQMLDHLNQAIGQTKPPLSLLLRSGWANQALSPFQAWEAGRLHLHLYLANTGERPTCRAQQSATGLGAETLVSSSCNGKSHSPTAAAGFTLDDFAEVLEDDPQTPNPGILGDWLTFTDETWVQKFLNSCACEIMLQHLPELQSLAEASAEVRELACMEKVFAATALVQGDQALSNHTFVHDPALVADVWLRLRWYFAHCSERIMQLMGGIACRALSPGGGWQRGYLHLRPLMTLTIQADSAAADQKQRHWVLDLGNGRLLPTQPPTLPEETVVAVVDNRNWDAALTIGQLTNRIHQDLVDYAPTIAALNQVCTSIHLHRLESEQGRQSGHLSLSWGFSLEATL